MKTLVLLIIALALLIAAECAVAYWLHHKIGIYKEQQRKWAVHPSLESAEFALKMLRRYSDVFFVEGNQDLNTATYLVSKHCRAMRKQIREQQDEHNGNKH